MNRIFKYSLEFAGKTLLKLPVGSTILSAIKQRGDIFVYAMIDEKELKTEIWDIEVRGTGHAASDLELHTFLCTIQDGLFVWHVFVHRGGE